MRDEDSLDPGAGARTAVQRRRKTCRRCSVSTRQGARTADFEAGIRSALERLLVSPDFLFRIEADPANVKPGAPYRLSDVELASRLSFFLWSSIPDDELLDLAIRGKLSDAKTLDAQVRRMLADPRARTALVQNFFSQWLQVRNVWLLTPDASRQYPWFDDNLRTAFVKETELFLESQLRDDRSIVELLTANYTYLNEQLARHYGIRDVYGSHFRRVTLADQNRWGLLGKASILSVTSYPHRTSPTIRGKWLLENILAAPVPPPPPDVNTTLDEGEDGENTSVREMLEHHRANPACASCHAQHGPARLQPREFRRDRPMAHDRTASRRSTRPACCWTARRSTARPPCAPRCCSRRISSSRRSPASC